MPKNQAMPKKRTLEQSEAIKELEGFFEQKKAEQQALRKLLEELKKKLGNTGEQSETINHSVNQNLR